MGLFRVYMMKYVVLTTPKTKEDVDLIKIEARTSHCTFYTHGSECVPRCHLRQF